MTDRIRYDFGTIEAGRQDIARSAATINGRLDDLKRHLAPLVAEWDGEAAEAYRVQQQKWDAAAADLNHVLARIGAAVGAGNDTMADVNRQAAASWG